MESDADHAQGGSTGQVDPNQSGSFGPGKHKKNDGKGTWTHAVNWEPPKHDWGLDKK